MVFRGDLSDVLQLVLALLPIPSGLLSFVASSTIILSVCRSKRTSSYRRIMIGLSVSDIFMILAQLTGPILVPHESSIILPFKDRNKSTCILSGALSVTSNSLYSGFLAIYFLFTVRLGWSPPRFARTEPCIHLFIITNSIVFFVIAIGLDKFATARTGRSCWIASEDVFYYYLALAFMVGLGFFCILVCNLSIYLHVRSLTRRSLRRSMNPSVATNRKNLVAAQSFCYVAAYATTWTASFILGLHELSGGVVLRSAATYFVCDAVHSVLNPLTGFLNLMVFLRPRYLQLRKHHPNATKWHCVQVSLSKAFQTKKRQPTKPRSYDRVHVSQQGEADDQQVEDDNIVLEHASSELVEEAEQDPTDPTNHSSNTG